LYAIIIATSAVNVFISANLDVYEIFEENVSEEKAFSAGFREKRLLDNDNKSCESRFFF